MRKSHLGPLVVQKPLYPEGPAVCHTLIVHPPGGIVGGDQLEVAIGLRERSHVLITLPGAGKWYRSQGAAAVQRVRLEIAANAMLEWLPPETIVYDGARAETRTTVDVEAGGCYIGWEILSLGRTAAGERFDRGEIRQSTELNLDGAPAWIEHCRLHGGSPLLQSDVGLAGAPVSALMIAAGRSVPAALVAQCRAVGIEADARSGITAFGRMLIARYAGCSCEQARCYFVGLWRLLRPFFCGRDAVMPRIWNT